jgi:hypothetical protein
LKPNRTILLLLGGLALPLAGLEVFGSDGAGVGGSPAAYVVGAPPGFSGGFGEMSCDACHFDNPLNPPGGTLEFGGIPERYTPGERYPVTITLSRPGMKAGGFQLTARFASDSAQAGEVRAAEGEEGRITVTSDAGIAYLHQTGLGTVPASPDTARWSFLWTAPAESREVVFHLSGNAADGDGSTGGDFVYTAVAASQGAQP